MAIHFACSIRGDGGRLASCLQSNNHRHSTLFDSLDCTPCQLRHLRGSQKLAKEALMCTPVGRQSMRSPNTFRFFLNPIPNTKQEVPKVRCTIVHQMKLVAWLNLIKPKLGTFVRKCTAEVRASRLESERAQLSSPKATSNSICFKLCVQIVKVSGRCLSATNGWRVDLRRYEISHRREVELTNTEHVCQMACFRSTRGAHV